MSTCAIHGTKLIAQTTKWGVRWACPEAQCDQATWNPDIPTASSDVREAMKHIMEDLKLAVTSCVATEYCEKLYSKMQMVCPERSLVTVNGIREAFRSYDMMFGDDRRKLVDIVKELRAEVLEPKPIIDVKTKMPLLVVQKQPLAQSLADVIAKPTKKKKQAKKPEPKKPEIQVVEVAPKRKINLE